ncbi:MAG TPA: hypothetical protein VEC35_01875 [Noviherbaspirillum sp.]|nr:hypothetical protein [Noviherbaspirillum sp.]
MVASFHAKGMGAGGILVRSADSSAADRTRMQMFGHLEELGLHRQVKCIENACTHTMRLQLDEDSYLAWTPYCDTTGLCETLHLDTTNPPDLEREIFIAMLAGPIPFTFPSFEELLCAVHIRRNIVDAARRTALAFATSQAERPADYWTYMQGRGFTLLPGKSLIAALRKATQPEESGSLYSFSCYRATEYVILLAIAQEIECCNPELLERLQRHWESRAIMSGEFHDVFLREHGSMEAPLPLRYFVPGDRTWFRNPDDHSSDASGYEGSWVMYLGGGLFSNFWKRAEPYTLTGKCLEMYHWRHATYRDDEGELRIDESIVEERVRASRSDAGEVERILAKMLRHREPSGVYVDGGCIDTTREYARWVCPGTSDMVLPAH